MLTLKEVERDHILKALEEYLGNRTRTALALGISLRALRYKIYEYAKHDFKIPPKPASPSPPPVERDSTKGPKIIYKPRDEVPIICGTQSCGRSFPGSQNEHQHEIRGGRVVFFCTALCKKNYLEAARVWREDYHNKRFGPR